jgi:hypothetical protein
MEQLLGHEKIITKSGISLKAGTLNWGFTVLLNSLALFLDVGKKEVKFSNNIMEVE